MAALFCLLSKETANNTDYDTLLGNVNVALNIVDTPAVITHVKVTPAGVQVTLNVDSAVDTATTNECFDKLMATRLFDRISLVNLLV